MRVWSLHPQYLDSKGIVALWRETLLAKKVLRGLTKGYTKHPQLLRFRESADPTTYVDFYLSKVHEESVERGYKFDSSKFEQNTTESSAEQLMVVTLGQLEYEWKHLLRKLKERDPERFKLYKDLKIEDVKPHPLFKVGPGSIESWEVVTVKK